MIISDILSPIDVPSIVQSFFDHDRAVNYDGHTMPLLSIQVTELKDGVFIGCSMNHCIGDGTSYWHFFNTLSEIFQAQGNNISITRPPIHKQWFPDGVSKILNLPFTHQDEFISRVEAPKLRERMFQFSSQSIAKLKRKIQCRIQYQQNLFLSDLVCTCLEVHNACTLPATRSDNTLQVGHQ